MIKTEENCKRCLWGADNKCEEFFACFACPMWTSLRGCKCLSVPLGAECPYFEPWMDEELRHR